ncbi:helix-turn-helix transcriptional regulator [Phaeovulum sp. W22_SRMD_FR3]|uniref:helix-turn-helix transcriptional regulator n=1 Tax=Phaeovulum sp. W22_SRMD_FR3 TaxID=3240274 RepID=UPI003F99E394
MFLVSRSSGHAHVNLFVRGDPDFAQVYLDEYAHDDFRVPRVMARAAGRLCSERVYVSAAEARESRIHQELLPRFGIHDIHGCNLSFGENVGWFGIASSRPDRGIELPAVKLLETLAPHLLRAFRLGAARAGLDRADPSRAEAIDLFASAVFVLDGNRLVELNRSARQLLGEGWFRLSPDGWLTCADPHENLRLAAFQRSGDVDPEATALYLRHVDSNALYALRRWTSGGRRIGPRRSILTITQLTITPPDLEQVAAFCSPFGITPAESKVVHAILSCLPLSAFAHSTGTSLYTVQDQLKSAMLKMGMPSQKLVFAAFERYRTLHV